MKQEKSKEATAKVVIGCGLGYVTKRKPLWITLENITDDKCYTLKQHAFVEYKDRMGIIKNKSLCGRTSVGNDEGRKANYDEITERAEMRDDSNLCKKCRAIYVSNYAL